MEPRHHDQLAPLIRAARGADSARMGEIYVASWRDAYPILLPRPTLLAMSPARWARQFSWTISRGREITLVAEDRKHGIIGLATGGAATDKGLTIDGARAQGEIFSLYVAAEHTGLGAGKGLLKAMLRRLAERGYTNALAWMLKGNPARFFYEHMGARLVAEKQERRFGGVIGLEAYAWPDLACLGFRPAAS
jgi:GNAT superfamily N-acetyltransferase